MSILAHPRPRVHSKFAEIPVEPIRYDPDSDPEPFHPDAAGLAYDLAFTLARRGEPCECPTVGPILAQAVSMAHDKGDRDGRKAREVAEARELGEALGGIFGGPYRLDGLAAHEAGAFAAGLSDAVTLLDLAAIAEAEDDARTEAWVAHREATRLEEILHVEIRDADMYPSGCMS